MRCRTFVAPAALICALTSLTARPIEARQAPGPVSEAQLVEARARLQLDSGKYGESQQTFAAMLPLARTRRDSAASFFGRAFAEQQTIETDSVPKAFADRLVRDYRRAQRLDPSTYGDAAQFNIALLFSSGGRHDSAAFAYVRASQTSETRGGPLLLSAAREFRMAGQPAAALSRARQAARYRSVAPEAQILLIELHRDQRDMASLVRLADTLQSPSAPLAEVNGALADMMRDRRWASTPWAERCLILLARNYAALDVGPTYFAETQRVTLERAATANEGTEIAPAIQELVDAYRVRDSTDVYRKSAGPSWWMRPSADDRRRATWSRTLRGLGDWYNRAGFNKVAISFYESALGAPTFPVFENWVDPDALPPLPALYATLPDTGALWDRLYHVEDLTKALYEGKSAVRPGNDRRLRLMRLTLGHLFAQQGQWDNGWRGAILQLEESRRIGKRMVAENPGQTPYFPTDVYELLFAEYVRRGCRAEGLSLGQELRDEYERRGAIAERDRIIAAMGRLQTAPPRAGVSCTGAPNT